MPLDSATRAATRSSGSTESKWSSQCHRAESAVPWRVVAIATQRRAVAAVNGEIAQALLGHDAAAAIYESHSERIERSHKLYTTPADFARVASPVWT